MENAKITAESHSQKFGAGLLGNSLFHFHLQIDLGSVLQFCNSGRQTLPVKAMATAAPPLAANTAVISLSQFPFVFVAGRRPNALSANQW